MSSNSTSKLPFARCDECSLRQCPVVPASGPLNAKLVVVGEAPGAVEVEKGEPFVGPSGVLLDYAFKQANINPDDVYKTNVVMCRPPNNREPSPEEVAACLPRLVYELEQTEQAPVLALGMIATEALQMDEHDRGVEFDWFGRPGMHTYHPAYILRKPSESPIFTGDVKKFMSEPIYKNPKWEDPTVIHIEDPLGLKMVLDKVPDGTWVAFDLETDNTRWFALADGTPPDPILMLQIAWTDDFGIVIDDIMLYDVPETRIILRDFFARVKTTAHNGKFDQVFLLAHLGIYVHLDFDTMLAHAALDENSKHGLKEITFKYFGIEDYEERLIKQYLKNRNDRYSKIPFEPLSKYGVIDVIMTLQFRKLFQEQLEAQGRLEWPFQNVLMRGANNFVHIEFRGIAVDVPYLTSVQRFLQGKMDEQLDKVRNMVAWPELNLNSTQQVATILYDMLKMPPPKNRRTPRRSTNHEVLEALAGRHPVIDEILVYRRVMKMKTSYADNILEVVDINGRVHASFVIPGTEVGRLAARNPALQTIPRPEEEKDGKGMYGRLIRGAFIAPPGKILLIVDYSQAELRVVAVAANETFLLEAYRNGRDIHSEVAIAMYGPNYTKEQRVQCKMFNFSYIYGGSEYSFAMDAGLRIDVARKFVQDYNKVMPNLAKYRQDQFKRLAEDGFVQSPFGRRRHFELITRVNMDEARKAAVHAPTAGTASDLTLLSGCEMNENGYEVVLMVHDSVILEVPIENVDHIAEYAVQVMKNTGEKYLPEVAWKADPEKRMRWADPPTEFLVQSTTSLDMQSTTPE